MKRISNLITHCNCTCSHSLFKGVAVQYIGLIYLKTTSYWMWTLHYSWCRFVPKLSILLILRENVSFTNIKRQPICLWLWNVHQEAVTLLLKNEISWHQVTIYQATIPRKECQNYLEIGWSNEDLKDNALLLRRKMWLQYL